MIEKKLGNIRFGILSILLHSIYSIKNIDNLYYSIIEKLSTTANHSVNVTYSYISPLLL